MRWLGYLWTVAVNCFYLLIIVAVFDKLYQRPEAVVVAILGLIYVTIRMIGIGLSMGMARSLLHLNKQLLCIRSLLNDPATDYEAEFMRELEKADRDHLLKRDINVAFLGITTFVCLLFLGMELWG